MYPLLVKKMSFEVNHCKIENAVLEGPELPHLVICKFDSSIDWGNHQKSSFLNLCHPTIGRDYYKDLRINLILLFMLYLFSALIN